MKAEEEKKKKKREKKKKRSAVLEKIRKDREKDKEEKEEIFALKDLFSSARKKQEAERVVKDICCKNGKWAHVVENHERIISHGIDLGNVSHKMSIITIFGHKYFK